MRQFDYTCGEAKSPPLTGPGESTVPLAPVLQVQTGELCIPQHFLRYAHSRETVEAIVAQIDYDPRYPIFVSGEPGEIYIQVGIVGPDNYKDGADKLVYGRKWRVEPNLPTSEIIQTAFLALKKAREHELREVFVVLSNGLKTTPFNGHQDLPHMARHAHCYLRGAEQVSPRDVIDSVRYDGARFELSHITPLPTGQSVISVEVKGRRDGEFASLCKAGLSMICDNRSSSALLHGLFEACLKTSDRHVDENFRYGGFARFSHDVSVFEIAKLSSKQRQCPTSYLPKEQATTFIGQLKSENYETDTTRIPVLSDNAHNRALCTELTQMAVTPPPIG